VRRFTSSPEKLLIAMGVDGFGSGIKQEQSKPWFCTESVATSLLASQKPCGFIEIFEVLYKGKGLSLDGWEKGASLCLGCWEKVIEGGDVSPIEGLIADGVGVVIWGWSGAKEAEALIAQQVQWSEGCARFFIDFAAYRFFWGFTRFYMPSWNIPSPVSQVGHQKLVIHEGNHQGGRDEMGLRKVRSQDDLALVWFREPGNVAFDAENVF